MSDVLNAIQSIRTLLADCYWWRAWKSELTPYTQEQALARIHIDALPAPNPGPDHSLTELQGLRPFALVWQDTANGFITTADGGGGCCSTNQGKIILQIEYDVPSDLRENPTAVAEDCYRRFGRILQTRDPAKPGLWDLAGLPGRPRINKTMLSGLVRTQAKEVHELGDAMVGEIELHWGFE